MEVITMTGLKTLVISLIAISLLLVGISDANINPENCVGMWLFDEGSGDTATDSSSSGNDGEIIGATWVQGKFGQALSFDGEDDWVSVPDSDTVGFTAGTSFTITVHFKGTKVGGSLVGKGYEDTSQATPWYLLWNDGSSDTVSLYLRDEAGTSFPAHGTGVVADDSWHFVVGMADASTGKSSIWVDGTKEVEVDFNKDSGYGTADTVFHIGRHYDRYTQGIIDDVGLFNVALDEGDIIAIMNDGLRGVITSVEKAGKLASKWGSIKQMF